MWFSESQRLYFITNPVWLASKCEIPKAVSFNLPEMLDCLTDVWGQRK